MDPSRAGAAAGEAIIGAIVGGVLMVAILVLFVISLVRYISSRKTGWLIGLVATSLIGLLMLGGGIFAAVKGFKSAAAATSPTPLSTPDGVISMSVPGHWKPMVLMPEAVLQSGNGQKEEYMITLYQTKKDFTGSAEDYADNTSRAMLKSEVIQDATRTSVKTLTVDGHPAAQAEVSGELKGHPIVYLLTVVETSGGFYQILQWTLVSKRASTWPDFEGVVASLRVNDKNRDPDVPIIPRMAPSR